MKRILLIEDNSSDRLIIQMALREKEIPFSLQELTDGEQALQFIQQAEKAVVPPKLDLVLLDLNLPRYNGHDLLGRLRACFPVVPILVISSAHPRLEQPKLAMHTPHYFRKPYGLDDFLASGETIVKLLSANKEAES